MAKTKEAKPAKAVKANKDTKVSKDTKAISAVKDSAVTKPSQTPKSKSKELAKQVATKADKQSSKKKAKAPSPEPSTDEESDSDEETSSASSASSKSESEVEAARTTKPNGKANGTAKAPAPAKKAESVSPETSDSSESSEDEAPVPSKPAPAAAAKKSNAKSDSSDSEEEDSDASESDDEEPAPVKSKGPVDAKALNGALKDVSSKQKAPAKDESDDSEASSASEDDDEEDSDDSGSTSDDDSEEDKAPPKKRKAESDETATAKKPKTTNANAEDTGSKNLFVGNLSWNVDEDWLTREFEEFGELTGARIISDKQTGRSKGFGYVEFANSADAAKALKAKKDAMIDGRKANVDFSTPRNNDAGPGDFKNRANSRAESFGDQTSPESDTLFVGNISFEANEDILSEEFGKYGTVIGVRLPTDMDSGNPKGFGYVQFASVDEAREALNNMKGAAICDRPIRLDFSTPRQNTGGSPRGGRGGGRGFGDRGGRGGGRGFGDRGGRGGGGRGFGDRGGRGGSRGGRGSSTNRGGFGDFQGKKKTF